MQPFLEITEFRLQVVRVKLQTLRHKINKIFTVTLRHVSGQGASFQSIVTSRGGKLAHNELNQMKAQFTIIQSLFRNKSAIISTRRYSGKTQLLQADFSVKI